MLVWPHHTYSNVNSYFLNFYNNALLFTIGVFSSFKNSLTLLTTDPHFWSSTPMVKIEIIILQLLFLLVRKLLTAKI